MAKAFDPEVNDALRSMARRIVASGVKQAVLADRIGVSAGFISDFLSEKRGGGMRVLTGLGRSYPLEFLELVGIEPATVATLWVERPTGEDDQGGEMRVLPESVRRAARAAIELDGCAPADAARAAAMAVAEFGEVPQADPDWWLGKLRRHLPDRTGSGVRPASRS